MGFQRPEAALARFAIASNTEDFPAVLAFVAEATSDAKAKSQARDRRSQGIERITQKYGTKLMAGTLTPRSL